MSEGSRWSCAPKLGGPCSISYDLGAEYNFEQLRLRKQPPVLTPRIPHGNTPCFRVNNLNIRSSKLVALYFQPELAVSPASVARCKS